MSVAELGLAVDSGSVKDATSALKEFTGAAGQAERSASATVAAIAKGKPGAQAFAEGFQKADAAQKQYTSSANKVVDTLANQFARLNMTSRQWQILQNVQKAGESLNTSSGQQIAKMTGALYDLEQAQKKVGGADNDNVRGWSKLYGEAARTLGIFGLGFGTVLSAAVQLFSYLETQAPTSEKLLKEHDRLLKVIKDSYDAVTQATKNWADQSRDVTRLQLLQQEVDLRQKLVEATAKSIRPAVRMDILTGEVDVREELRPFRDAIATLNEGWQNGTPNVRAYVDEIARISLLNPALQKMGTQLIESVGDASKFAKTLEQIREMLNVVDGNKPTPGGKKLLDLPETPKTPTGPDPFLAQVNSINKHIAAMNADALAVNATAGEHARLRTEAQLLEAAQRNGGQATAAQITRMQELGRAASDAAMNLERARVTSDIKFGAQTTLLSPEDVQIAQQLKGLYPDVATALGSVEAQAMRVNSAMRQMSDLGQDINRGMMVEFGQQIRNGASAFEALQRAGTNALGKIADKLASMAADNLWKSAFGGTSGNIFSSLFGGGGGAATMSGAGLGAGTGGLSFPMFNAKGNAFDQTNVIPFARGGIVNSPTLFQFANGGAMANGVMGEAGPEAIMPLTRGANGKLGVRMEGAEGSAAPIVVHGGDVQITVQGNADEKTLGMMKRELAMRDAAFASRVVETVKRAKSGRQL